MTKSEQQASDENAFAIWWHNEGSGMAAMAGEDAETHVHRVTRIAWMNGAFKAREPLKP